MLLALAAMAAKPSDDLITRLTAMAAENAGVTILGVAARPGGRGISHRSPLDRRPRPRGRPRSEHEYVLALADGPFVDVWSPDDLAHVMLLADHNGHVRDLHSFTDTAGIPALASTDDLGTVQVRDLDLRGGPRFTMTVDGMAPAPLRAEMLPAQSSSP